MAFALQYLHQVIHKPHGSVNPHNIFGVEKDGRVCWKLAKYGLRMTKDEYRAPEVTQLDYYVISRTTRPFGPLDPCSSSPRMDSSGPLRDRQFLVPRWTIPTKPYLHQKGWAIMTPNPSTSHQMVQ